MPKARPEGCMICDPDPCQCFAKPVKAKKAPAPKRPVEERPPETAQAEPLVAPAPRPDLKARMKAAAAAAPAKPLPVLDKHVRKPRDTGPVTGDFYEMPEPPKKAVVRTEKSEEDILLHAAIRNLKDILHEDELTQWSMVATSSPSASERAVEWKARRAWQLAQSTSG